MKAKTLKKTIAAVMALTFLSGAAPVFNGGASLFDTALIANADDEKTYTFTYNATTKEGVVSGVMPLYDTSISGMTSDIKHEIKKLTFTEGTVLPEDCRTLLSSDYYELETVDLTGADLSKVKRADYMFANCKKLKNVYFNNTDFSAVTSMSEMFNYCSSLVNVENLTASSTELTNLNWIFNLCKSLTEIDLRNINTENVVYFSNFFADCYSLESVDFSNFKTGNAVYMNRMFSNCVSLTKLDLSGFETSKVEDMSSMFYNCCSLVSLDVSSFRTQNVKKFDSMFCNCRALEKLDLSSFDTSNAETIDDMFENCYSLRDLDISGFNTIDKTGSTDMFYYAQSLRKIKVGSGVDKLTLSNIRSREIGWVKENAPDTVVSIVDDVDSVIENSGENTYIRNQAKGHIKGIGLDIFTDGTLGMRVVVELPDDLTDEEKAAAKVEFQPHYGGVYEAIPVQRDKDGNYYVIKRILSKEMADGYFIDMYIDKKCVDSAFQSVRQYASKILTAPETYPDEQNLVKAMLLYGGAAQRQFNYYINDEYKPIADHGITYTAGGLNYERQFFGPKGAGAALGDARYAGSSIVLGSGVVQRHYFTVNPESLDQHTFEVDGKIVTPTNKSDDLYYVDAVKNSSMMVLDVPSKINVWKNNDPEVKMTLDYSVMDYVATLRGTAAADSTEYAVVENLSRLAKEAKAYFNR